MFPSIIVSPNTNDWVTVFENITFIEDAFFTSVCVALYGSTKMDKSQLFKARELSIKLFNTLIDNGFNISSRLNTEYDREQIKYEFNSLI